MRLFPLVASLILAGCHDFTITHKVESDGLQADVDIHVNSHAAGEITSALTDAFLTVALDNGIDEMTVPMSPMATQLTGGGTWHVTGDGFGMLCGTATIPIFDIEVPIWIRIDNFVWIPAGGGDDPVPPPVPDSIDFDLQLIDSSGTVVQQRTALFDWSSNTATLVDPAGSDPNAMSEIVAFSTTYLVDTTTDWTLMAVAAALAHDLAPTNPDGSCDLGESAASAMGGIGCLGVDTVYNPHASDWLAIAPRCVDWTVDPC